MGGRPPAAPLGSGRRQPRVSAMQINELITRRRAQRIIQQARPGSGSQGEEPEEAGAEGLEVKGCEEAPGHGSRARALLGDFSRVLCSPPSPTWGHTLKSNSGPGEACAAPTCKRSLLSPFLAPRSLPRRAGPAPAASPNAPGASCSQVGASPTPGSWLTSPGGAGTRGQTSPYSRSPFRGSHSPNSGRRRPVEVPERRGGELRP